MRKNTFLIRFIDIGLIILFGFIVISDITVRSQIELPGSDQGEANDESMYFMIQLTIQTDNLFVLSDYFDDDEIGSYYSISELEEALVQIKDELSMVNRYPVIIIEIEPSITMQTMVYVFDVCDRLNIPKNVSLEEFRL